MTKGTGGPEAVPGTQGQPTLGTGPLTALWGWRMLLCGWPGRPAEEEAAPPLSHLGLPGPRTCHDPQPAPSLFSPNSAGGVLCGGLTLGAALSWGAGHGWVGPELCIRKPEPHQVQGDKGAGPARRGGSSGGPLGPSPGLCTAGAGSRRGLPTAGAAGWREEPRGTRTLGGQVPQPRHAGHTPALKGSPGQGEQTRAPQGPCICPCHQISPGKGLLKRAGTLKGLAQAEVSTPPTSLPLPSPKGLLVSLTGLGPRPGDPPVPPSRILLGAGAGPCVAQAQPLVLGSDSRDPGEGSRASTFGTSGHRH